MPHGLPKWCDFVKTSVAQKEPYWQLLELISIADPGDETWRTAEELFAEGVDIDLLLSFAARHRMVAVLADFVRRAGAIYDVPAGVQHLLNNTLDWTRHRARLLAEAAGEIAGTAGERGLDIVFNKGIVLQSTLYDDRGVRFFADVDLMVGPDQRRELAAALRDLGYSEGQEYDAKTEQLVDLPREYKLIYQLYPDHLPHFHRLTAGSGVPFNRVDVAFNLTWYGSAWQVPMSEVLKGRATARLGDGTELPVLDPVYGFLFLVLHLFRESWFQRTAEAGGLRLIQFADIRKFWERYGRPVAAELTETIGRHDLGPAVAWVCHHVDELFGGEIVAELGLGRFQEPEWLRSAGAKDGTSLAWDGDMRARLAAREPLVFRQAAEPPFAAQARIFKAGAKGDGDRVG